MPRHKFYKAPPPVFNYSVRNDYVIVRMQRQQTHSRLVSNRPKITAHLIKLTVHQESQEVEEKKRRPIIYLTLMHFSAAICFADPTLCIGPNFPADCRKQGRNSFHFSGCPFSLGMM